MKKEDFPLIHIGTAGQFRLVEEKALDTILSATTWIKYLALPSTGLAAFGFSVRHFRETKNISVNELSKMTGIHRSQLTQIEKATLKRKPHLDTVRRLIEVFGEDFEIIAKLQGII